MPIGIVMATDVFQSRLSGLFSHLSYVIVYIDDIAIIGYGAFEEHTNDVWQVLEISSKTGI